MNIRIIPRLDIKGPNVVKGIHFEGLRVLGKPEHFARYYYESGADELIYMDAVASLYGRNSLLAIVERTAREIFIPLTVGGGLRSVEDIRAVLRAGADKVSLNTAALGRPELVREAARAFGSSTIVVSIEAIRLPDGRYEAYVDYGRQATGVDVFEWARRAVELGAGELMVTSINAEGTGQGFDLELTRRIAEAVPVPVIAAGGAGRVEHVRLAGTVGRAGAVALAKDAARDQALVAGSVSRTQLVEREGIGSLDKARDHIAEQIRLLKDAGVDFLILETFFHLAEMEVALQAARESGLPAIATMSFRPLIKQCSDGHSPAECARVMAELGACAVGANCEQDPSRMLPLLRQMSDAVDVPIAAQPAAFRTAARTAPGNAAAGTVPDRARGADQRH